METGNLAAFLEAVRIKRVQRGSVLIVENLDRLSRNQTLKAVTLFSSILEAGITVVTLEPEREYTYASVNENIMQLMEAVMTLFLGHEESRKKSKRVQEEWRARLSRLHEEKITARVPSWLRLAPDRKTFIQKPQAVKTVKQIFTLAVDGYGVHAIARRLNERGTPNIGRGETWHPSYIRKVLSYRAVLGEYQSYTGDGVNKKPFGPVVPDYFPRIISEADFYAAQKAIQSRRRQVGPRGKQMVNLFTGLLRDARDTSKVKGTMTVAAKQTGERMLVSSKAARAAGSTFISFPYQRVEDAILMWLTEIKPSDILPPSEDANLTEERMAELTGKLADLDFKINQTKARIDQERDIETFLDVLASCERQRNETAAALERLKEETAGGSAETVGECQSLVNLVRSVEGEECEALRTRLSDRA